MSVSLDGFVAEPDGGVERVFAWYGKPQPESQPRDGAAVSFVTEGIETAMKPRRSPVTG